MKLAFSPWLFCVALAAGGSALAGPLYVTERGTNEVSVVNGGVVTTLTAGTAGLDDPLDIALLPDGNLVVTERNGDELSFIDAQTGAITATTALGFSPNDLLIDPDGAIWVSSFGSTPGARGVFRKGAAESSFSLVADISGNLGGLTRLGGFVFTTEFGSGSLIRIDPGETNPTTSFTSFAGIASAPIDLIADGSGLLISEFNNNRVVRVTNVLPGQTPTAVSFATGVANASAFARGDELFVTLQESAGGLATLDAGGAVTVLTLTGDTLTGPRGIATLGTAVPEPAAGLWLVGAGLLAGARCRNR